MLNTSDSIIFVGKLLPFLSLPRVQGVLNFVFTCTWKDLYTPQHCTHPGQEIKVILSHPMSWEFPVSYSLANFQLKKQFCL